jgi:hypothetical protein
MTTTMSLIGTHEARELARPLEPTASVYYGPDSSRSGPAQRYRAFALSLREQGASELTIEAVSGCVASRPEHIHEYAVFARDGEIVLAHHLPGAVPTDIAVYGSPARTAPLMAWLQRHPSYVRVATDRMGADILTVPAGALQGMNRIVGPAADTGHAGPHAPWSRRADHTVWHRTPEAIAAAVGEEIDRVSAGLVLVTGDPRMALLLTEDLRTAGYTCAVRGLPASGGSAADRARATIEAVRGYSIERTAMLLDRLEDEQGFHGRALLGRIAVLSALAEGQVSTLLVADDGPARRRAWFGPDLLCAAAPPPSRHAALVQRGDLADVAIRAALLTRANVRVLTPVQGALLEDGIAALRRRT